MPTPPTTTNRSSRVALPQQIATQRLVLRTWRATDAPLLKAAIDANVAHLRDWMPWATKEPSTMAMIQQRLERFDRLFRAESEWSYAMFSEGEKMLYGGAGLVRSTEPRALEVGFWLQQSWMKQGFATEAVKALANAALGLPNVDRVQIRCDARNLASASVARRAGFRHLTDLENHVFEPGAAPRTTIVWEMTRSSASTAQPAKERRGFWARLKALFTR